MYEANFILIKYFYMVKRDNFKKRIRKQLPLGKLECFEFKYLFKLSSFKYYLK